MPKFLIYRDRVGEYRWRLKAKNGRILADSAGGYHSAKACRRSIAASEASVEGSRYNSNGTWLRIGAGVGVLEALSSPTRQRHTKLR